MKRVVLAGLVSLVAVSTAFAAARSGINMPNDLRAKISADVVKQKPTAGKTGWRRGRKIDDGVELKDIPADWGKDITKYKYIYTGNQVWFVDPASRRAIDVIKVSR